MTGVLKDQVSGETVPFRARYVLAADGTRSFVREKLGIGRTGEKDIYDLVNVHFRVICGHGSKTGRPRSISSSSRNCGRRFLR